MATIARAPRTSSEAAGSGCQDSGPNGIPLRRVREVNHPAGSCVGGFAEQRVAQVLGRHQYPVRKDSGYRGSVVRRAPRQVAKGMDGNTIAVTAGFVVGRRAHYHALVPGRRKLLQPGEIGTGGTAARRIVSRVRGKENPHS